MEWASSAARTFAGQGATEYLVLLAVVLIIALVSIALLGFFPGISSDAKITQSASYWRGDARPFQVLDAAALASDSPCGVAGGGGYAFTLQNTEADSLTLTGVNIDGANKSFCLPGSAAGQVKFGPGQKSNIHIDLRAPLGCTVGKQVEIGLGFNYSSRYISNKLQSGSKKLVFTCGTATAGAAVCGGAVFGACPGGFSCCDQCDGTYACNVGAMCLACS
jgi:hypothetical protein